MSDLYEINFIYQMNITAFNGLPARRNTDSNFTLNWTCSGAARFWHFLHQNVEISFLHLKNKKVTQSDSTRLTFCGSTMSQLKIYQGDRAELYRKKSYTQLKKSSVPLDFEEILYLILKWFYGGVIQTKINRYD